MYCVVSDKGTAYIGETIEHVISLACHVSIEKVQIVYDNINYNNFSYDVYVDGEKDTISYSDEYLVGDLVPVVYKRVKEVLENKGYRFFKKV